VKVAVSIFKLFLGALVLLAVAGHPPAFSEEYAVPNQGSPYRDLRELKDNEILHLPTGIKVSRDQMVNTVASSRVIYIGETHDNLEAHRAQLEVLQGLHQRFPGQMVLGLEMFRRSAQPDLDAWHRGELKERDFRQLFHQHWGMSYMIYQPIFEFARISNIPLLGLKSTQDMEQQFREAGPGQPGMPEIDENDPYHRAYSLSLFGGNSTHTDVVSKPYRMLLLWEETMAETVARFLQDPQNDGKKLVVLAGGFHVQYGYGIPKRAFRRVPHPYSIILPVVPEIPTELKESREMKMDKVAIPLYSADFAWKLQYIVPPPKTIRLGVLLETLDEGLRVRQVAPQSNAERMKIAAEDVLLKLNGEKVTTGEEFSDRLQKYQIGETIHLTLRRGEQVMDVSGTLQKSEPHKK